MLSISAKMVMHTYCKSGNDILKSRKSKSSSRSRFRSCTIVCPTKKFSTVALLSEIFISDVKPENKHYIRLCDIIKTNSS